MQRRIFPSILLYGFGLALALSLLFNGFLLYKQSHQRSIYEDESGGLADPVDDVTWQRQRSDGNRASRQKDGRIGSPTGSPVKAGLQRTSGQSVIVQHTPSN